VSRPQKKKKRPPSERKRDWKWQLRRWILAPIYAVPALICGLLGIRFVWMGVPTRIGHVALELDSFIKDVKLQELKIKPVLPISRHKIPNPALVEYWRNYFYVIQNHTLVKWLRPFGFFRPLNRYTAIYAVAINETCRSYEVNAKWEGRPPLLTLSTIDRERGEAALARLGLPRGAWFACIHSRESGYSGPNERWHNERGQAYRNSDIADYQLAMQAIVERGGWCIRVGDPSMKPLPPMERVIDYAHSPEKADWLDVFLCASCRLFIGNSSGLAIVAGVFGVPCALANQAPPAVAYSHFNQDISIPKLVRRVSGDVLNFPEIFSSPIANYRYTELMEAENLAFIDNSAEEIRDLTIEMLDRIEGVAQYTEEDERLQARFKSLLRLGHYSYGARSRLGRDFLRKYAHLLK
jgi:putative glycosyltransferase (TIGR04372 family)